MTKLSGKSLLELEVILFELILSLFFVGLSTSTLVLSNLDPLQTGIVQMLWAFPSYHSAADLH